ncbi:hypothetical protein [Proteiniphilum acetatigenes]|jgi:hypothetical protein|uniref:hypothetical protein n=1 Tax=Proteiniphilum acetatigenes TaxID=294710 RepID=UPI00035FEEBB|nr:hypothetical protein [Proteiniphilum acetatigenes]SFK63901.1 hypothetical protein SAMN05216357_10442 [Porphyromonadaceae bacterium KH3CP3RA]
MKTLLFILFTILPFTLSAQFTVKAFRTTDEYNRKVIRIEVKNTSNYDLRIRNRVGGGPENGTLLFFSSTKEIENNASFSFYPNPFEPKLSKLRNVIIEKGKTEKADISLDEVANDIPIDKKIYLLGHIEYSFLHGDYELKWKDIELEVE